MSERWLSILFLWPTYCYYLEWCNYLNFSKERLPLPYIEEPNKWGGKKIRKWFYWVLWIQRFFQSLNCPEIYRRQSCSWEETKQNAQDDTEGEREKKRKRKRGKEKKREGGKASEKKEPPGLMFPHPSCIHMPIWHLQACSSAGCKAPLIFTLQCWRSSKFYSPCVDLHRDSMLEMHSLATVLLTYLAFPSTYTVDLHLKPDRYVPSMLPSQGLYFHLQRGCKFEGSMAESHYFLRSSPPQAGLCLWVMWVT